MSLVNFKTIRKCYQMTLKIEEKRKRKQETSKVKLRERVIETKEVAIMEKV